MRHRDLTEIIGKRNRKDIGRILARQWDSWTRFERAEAAELPYSIRRRRREDKLHRLGIRC